MGKEIINKLRERFAAKVALITGGGSGLGRESALQLAREGAAVGVAGRTVERLHSVCQTIIATGGRALAIKCDVTQESDCKYMVDRIVDEYGQLDVLITSAGIHGGGRTVVDTPVVLWDQVVNTDLKGAYLSSKYAIPAMRKVNGGSIVHVSSIGGMRGSPQGMAFQAAKGGLINLTRHMAVAHAAEHIRVNCLCPGVFKTPLTEHWLSNPKTYQLVCQWHPMNRIGETAEIVAAALFLASDEASFITGALLPVDGGYLAAGRGTP